MEYKIEVTKNAVQEKAKVKGCYTKEQLYELIPKTYDYDYRECNYCEDCEIENVVTNWWIDVVDEIEVKDGYTTFNVRFGVDGRCTTKNFDKYLRANYDCEDYEDEEEWIDEALIEVSNAFNEAICFDFLNEDIEIDANLYNWVGETSWDEIADESNEDEDEEA